ncbi:unnamed protein product, partial [Prorocentrum cordatum]
RLSSGCSRSGNHGVELPDNAVTNVIWKLAHYLNIGKGVGFDINNPHLKELQRLVPSAPTVEVRSTHGRCPRCHIADPQKCALKTSSRVAFNVQRRNGGKMVLETRFRVYTVGAGVQNASFSKEYYPKCALYFLGQWQCEKHDRSSGRGTYGKMINIKLVSGSSSLKHSFVPREKAWRAVDAKLLQFLKDELHHSGGTFNSAVLVWSEQHTELAQRGLVPGEDLTLLRANGVRLEDAWYAHHAARLAGGAASELTWSFTRGGLESTLLALAPAVRHARVERAVEHARACPKCAGDLLVLLGGTYGARRFVCGGLDGYENMGALQMELYAGCLKNAPAGRFFCAQCQTARAGQNNLIPQTQIWGIAPATAPDGEVSALKYLARCSDPDNPSETFDAFLPRAEVSQELLATCEKPLLPANGDHGSKKARPAWLKGAKRQLCRGWLALEKEQKQSILACGVDELQGSDKVRRCTGGIMTAVASCGWLMDWMELTRGESIEVVYAFALRLHKAPGTSAASYIGWLGYVNACELLSMARVKKDGFLPWTKSLAEEVRIILDGFHRDNHAWCLNALREVDPLQPANVKFLALKNTEACEQFSAWISPRTRMCLEMTR